MSIVVQPTSELSCCDLLKTTVGAGPIIPVENAYVAPRMEGVLVKDGKMASELEVAKIQLVLRQIVDRDRFVEPQ